MPLNSLSKQDLFAQIQSPWDKGKATAFDARQKKAPNPDSDICMLCPWTGHLASVNNVDVLLMAVRMWWGLLSRRGTWKMLLEFSILRWEAQIAKCLPCQDKDLSLVLRRHIKMPDVVACNLTLWRQRQEDPLGLMDSQCSLIGDLPANGRCVQRK